MQELWFDFEFMHYKGDELVIMGNIDISTSHDIEIIFRDVFFVCCPIAWKVDTSQIVLTLVEGEEARRLNKKFDVEIGYLIFKFFLEDLDGQNCYIAAKSLDYKLTVG